MRELILDHCGITVRKPIPIPAGPEATVSSARAKGPRQAQADSKLAALYQDTFEAPIPSDMMRLLEKIGTLAEEDR